jgi:hypothetical protein
VSKGLPDSRRRSTRANALAAVVAVLAALTFAGAAIAQEPPPPDDSAVDQYTEFVPTGRGPKAPGIGKKTRGSLPPKAKKALENTPKRTADALTEIATSSDYGAPARRAPEPVARDAPAPGEEPSLDRTLQATAVAAAPVDDGRMIGLLVVMLAIAVGGGALAVRRRGV